MIVSYPDRRFQMWEYRVSHGSLLVRSPRGPEAERNVDLVFVGVNYLAVPHSLSGVALEHGTADDLASVSVAFGEVHPDYLFVLVSQGRRYPVVAASCRVGENDGDIFDSPF